jgi:hypothetical protein
LWRWHAHRVSAAAAGSRVRLTATAAGAEKKHGIEMGKDRMECTRVPRRAPTCAPQCCQKNSRRRRDKITWHRQGRASGSPSQACDEFPSPSHLNATNADSSDHGRMKWIPHPGFLIIGRQPPSELESQRNYANAFR